MADSGGNFGRVSRTGIMDDYLDELSQLELRGIQIQHWRAFFKLFQEGATEEAIQAGIGRLRKLVESKQEEGDGRTASITKIMDELANLL